MTRAQTLDLCARLASYSEADAAPRDLLSRAGIEAVQRFPEDADVLTAVGRMFLAGEALHDAERVLRRAVRFAPQDPHALRMLGEVLLRSGDPGAAHAALSSAVACGMNDPWTKTWVARALDYSELLDDLGREGIAKDVRQVLGKPGQGPPDDERRLASLGQASPPARAYSRKGILGRIDKGVFFAGDARAELPDFRAGRLAGDDIVDLPTPVPGEASGGDADRTTPISQRPTMAGEPPAETTRLADPRRASGEPAARTREARPSGGIGVPTTRTRDPRPSGGIGVPTARAASRPAPVPAPARQPARRRDSSPEISIETALADDAAWGAPRSGPGSAPRSAPGSAPRSEPMPPSDTEISAWVPDMEAFARDRRSAPVELRDSGAPPPRRESAPPPRRESAPPPRRESSPPPHHESAPPPLREEDRRSSSPGRIAPPPPGMPRLTAAELYDEFTDHKRSIKSLHSAVEEALAEKAKRRGPPPLPPPLPPEPQAPPARPVESATLLTGKGGLLRDAWAPHGGEPSIHVLDQDAPEPVTAPPSALIPLDMAPVTAPPSALIPLDMGPVTAPPSALIPLDPDGDRASAREPLPPSAAFPPEPPSLQVPSRALLGGGLKAPTAAELASNRAAAAARAGTTPDAAEPDAVAAPAPAAKPKVKEPRSRLQTVILRALVALGVALVLLGGYQLYKRNRTTKMRVFAAQAAIALHAGGPRGVADAEAAIASARKLDAKSRAAALGLVRVRVFAVLDVDPARVTDLAAAMKDASALGVSAADLAFADITSHLATGDLATAAELVTHHDEDPERAGDALFQMAAGAVLEASDPPAAIERYRAALKIDEEYLPITIRLTRALAFSERGAEANDRLQTSLQKWPGRPELSALAAVVALADPARAANASLDPGTDVDMLPRPLRAAARILAKGNDEQAVAKATAEADIAPIIVLCGEAALRGGHEASARDAAQRAIDLAPSYAPAYALIARTALASARFEEARQAALRAPPEVASEVLSFIAYEAGDTPAMVSAAGRRATGPLTEPLAAGVARLQGAAPIASSALASLAKSGRFWADVVAMDGALDAGDLDLAQAIATSWAGGDKHPVRASRIARLYRYQGKNGAAQTASTSAAPTLAARVEAALAAAEMASARDAAVATLQTARTPEERWALAFLLAREGRAEAAHAALNGVTMPAGDAPFLTRRVAALALAELHTSNPTHPMYVSFDAWRRNPDVARALGIALPTAASPAAPQDAAPTSPALKGRIPRKEDSDPY